MRSCGFPDCARNRREPLLTCRAMSRTLGLMRGAMIEGRHLAGEILRGVAVGGRQVGLGVSSRGEIVWKSPRPEVRDLGVSGDDRLVLYRPEQGKPLVVTRAGRSIDAPAGKTVVLRGGDHLRIGGRHVRVHVHGHTNDAHASAPLGEASWEPAAKRLAAVVALTAAAAGCRSRCSSAGVSGERAPEASVSSIDVREAPPIVAPAPLSPSSPRNRK
jgi:hypothetical protein